MRSGLNGRSGWQYRLMPGDARIWQLVDEEGLLAELVVTGGDAALPVPRRGYIRACWCRG